MPPLPLTVDALDGVDEGVRTLYVERDGKFHLDVEGLPDTSGLTSALEKERKTRAEAEKRLKAFGNLTPEEIQKLRDEQRQRERTEAERRGEYESALKRASEEHQAALTERDGTIKVIRGALERHLIDAEATRAVSAAKGVPELLLPHIKNQVRVVEQDGEYRTEVVNGSGTPRLNGEGKPMSIDELVTEMRKHATFQRAFEPTGTRGSGAGNGAGGGGGGGAGGGRLSPEQIEGLPMAEYRRLRAEGKIA